MRMSLLLAREALLSVPANAFLLHEAHGAGRCVDFYRRWWEHRAVPRNFLAIRYEELRAKPSRWLGPLLRFLGLPDVNDSLVADAVEYASFENMQRMEATNHF